MKKAYTLQIVLAIIVLALIMSPMTFAADDTLTVNITISSVGAIVVLPNTFEWTLAPGDDSDIGISNITIKNIGSLNVTNMYLDTSTVTDESTNPIPTGEASAYSAAGMIFVRNSTNTTYFHAGRLEWNISSILAGEILDLDPATGTFGHGWYRNASGNEYLWKVENGTGGYCNNSGTTFEIKTAPENVTDFNRDLSSGLSTCTYAGEDDWASFACTDGPLADYCVATASTCDKIYIYKYNYNSTYAACGNRAYIRETDLVPGGEDYMIIHASVPYGMPAGETALGTLTLIAT